MEHFDIYDKEGNFLHKTATRGTPLPKGEYFMVIHVWIEREDGRFLIQKRAKKSDPIPHQWAITSGVTSKGETPLQGAIREVKEELGLTLEPADLEDRARIVSHDESYHTITHVYHTTKAPDIDDLRFQKVEVLDAKYRSLPEIKTMIEKGEFWNYPDLLNEDNYFSILERGSL